MKTKLEETYQKNTITPEDAKKFFKIRNKQRQGNAHQNYIWYYYIPTGRANVKDKY